MSKNKNYPSLFESKIDQVPPLAALLQRSSQFCTFLHPFLFICIKKHGHLHPYSGSKGDGPWRLAVTVELVQNKVELFCAQAGMCFRVKAAVSTAPFDFKTKRLPAVKKK